MAGKTHQITSLFAGCCFLGNESRSGRMSMGSRGKNRSGKKKNLPRSSSSGIALAPAVRTDEAPELELLSNKPTPRPGERIEDVAIFASLARQQLSEELRTEAASVAEALDKIHGGALEQALAVVKGIPVNSPYADWKLFIRGYVAFCNRDFAAAQRNWERLDPERRACRVAKTLLNAIPGNPSESAQGNDAVPPKRVALLETSSGTQQVSHTDRLLRHFMSGEGLLAAARRIASSGDMQSGATWSMKQFKKLEGFASIYRRAYPDFVIPFLQNAIQLASRQAAESSFKSFLPLATGPDFDPRWNLLRAFSCKGDLNGGMEYAQFIDAYLEADLGSIRGLTDEAKCVLKSLGFADLARVHLVLSSKKMMSQGESPFAFIKEIKSGRTRELLVKAIQAYPKNRQAHMDLIRLFEIVDSMEEQLGVESEDRGLFEAKLGFVEHFPNEIETKLWLVDWYFDHDEIDKAKSLVDTIDFNLTDSPISKAAKWKLLLSEAFYGSKRKSSLLVAIQSLQEAGACWPAWMPRHYFDYLQAALDLRAGRTELFVEKSQKLASAHGLSEHTHRLLLLISCTLMNVPSKETKSIRDGFATVEVGKLPFDSQLDLAGVFWDLFRSGVCRKICVTQARKIWKEIQSSLYMQTSLPRDRSRAAALEWVLLKDPTLRSLLGFDQLVKTNLNDPHVVYIFTQFVEKLQLYVEDDELATMRVTLEKATQSESDPFWYYHYKQALQELTSVIHKRANRSRFTRGKEAERDEDWDDEENDDWEDVDWEEEDDDDDNSPFGRSGYRSQMDYGSDDEDDELMSDQARLLGVIKWVSGQIGEEAAMGLLQKLVSLTSTPPGPKSAKRFCDAAVQFLEAEGQSIAFAGVVIKKISEAVQIPLIYECFEASYGNPAGGPQESPERVNAGLSPEELAEFRRTRHKQLAAKKKKRR
jgi:hypothetical protein